MRSSARREPNGPNLERPTRSIPVLRPRTDLSTSQQRSLKTAGSPIIVSYNSSVPITRKPVEQRPRTTEPSAAPLSERSTAVTASASANPSKPKVLRRKPSVIGQYVAKRKEKQSGITNVENLCGNAHAIPSVPSAPYKALPQLPKSSKTSLSSQKLVDRSPIEQVDAQADWPTSSDRRTPFSEASTVSSLPQAGSPFSLATSLTSKTSYSSTSSPVSAFGSPKSAGNSRSRLPSRGQDSARAAPLAGLSAPPELAHLSHAPGIAPSRPSRDDTPALDSEPLKAVIQSNLARLETPVSRGRANSSSRGTAIPAPPRSLSATSRKTEVSNISNESVEVEKANLSSESLPEPSPRPRFGFFSRRPKSTVASTSVPSSKSKLVRKGPMAGTGHEGYGKYAKKTRQGGTNRLGEKGNSAGNADRSGAYHSGESSNGDSEIDEFLEERLNPIYIRGNGSGSSVQVHSKEKAFYTAPGTPDSSVPDTPRTSNSSTEFAVQSGQVGQKERQLDVKRKPVGPTVMAMPDPPYVSSFNDSSDEEPRRGKPGSKAKFFGFSLLKKSNQRSQSKPKQSFRQRATQPDHQEVKPTHIASPAEPPPHLERQLLGHYDVHEKSDREPFDMLKLWPTETHCEGDESSIFTDFEDIEEYLYGIEPLLLPRTDPSANLTSEFERAVINHSGAPDIAPIGKTSLPEDSMDPNEGEKEASVQITPLAQAVARQDRQRQLPPLSFSRPFAPASLRQTKSHKPGALVIDPSFRPKSGTIEISLGSPYRDDTFGADLVPPSEFLQFEHCKSSAASSAGSSASYFPTTGGNQLLQSSLDTSQNPFSHANKVYVPEHETDKSRDMKMVSGKTAFPKLDFAEDNVEASAKTMASQITIQANSAAAGLPSVQPLETAYSAGAVMETSDNQKRHRASSVLFARAIVALKHKRTGPSSLGTRTHNEETDTSEALEDQDTFINLRFRALMMSRWLTFGRVLFSPASSEFADNGTGRILVLDGLGRDWSHYCALTYPKAIVYYLGNSGANSTNPATLGGQEPLTNYRHFTHPGPGTNFPFPSCFFAVVVVRFPKACTDLALKSAISEGKRVLRPGGFIEISTIDLDLANMGNKCRRAVRSLKMQMQSAVPEVSLKPASDQVQSLLGRRGFENLNRCIVGVPAAGLISDLTRGTEDRTIGDLVGDESPEGDEHIAKMVSHVGRFWYNMTYESEVDDGSNNSIFYDRALLDECEALTTSFKLLICFAQKPTVTKRRTVSL